MLRALNPLNVAVDKHSLLWKRNIISLPEEAREQPKQTKKTQKPPTNQPTNKKPKKEKIQPLGFVYKVIFIPALSEQGFGLTV